jgi:hypothetical protein
MSFKKYEKILDVDNDLTHKHVKHACRLYYWLYVYPEFIFIFLWILKTYFFIFFKQQKHWCLGAKKLSATLAACWMNAVGRFILNHACSKGTPWFVWSSGDMTTIWIQLSDFELKTIEKTFDPLYWLYYFLNIHGHGYTLRTIKPKET